MHNMLLVFHGLKSLRDGVRLSVISTVTGELQYSHSLSPFSLVVKQDTWKRSRSIQYGANRIEALTTHKSAQGVF